MRGCWGGLFGILWMGACFRPALEQPEVDSGVAEEVGDSVDERLDALEEARVEITDIDGACVEGEPCDDGDPCTVDDLCSSGACAGSAKPCLERPVCRQEGICDPGTGACVYPVALDGTSCSDGDRCTAGDRCVSGTCVPTRRSDDSFNDFAVHYSGDGGHRLAGVAIHDGEIAVLVEFPTEGEVENPTLSLGASTSGGAFTLGLPEGSKHGLALVRHSMRGAVIGASLIAHSQKPLSGRLAAGGGRLIGNARFEGVLTTENGRDVTSIATEGSALAALVIGGPDVEPWVIENGSVEVFRQLDHFLPFAGGCAVVANIQGGRRAEIRRHGQSLGEMVAQAPDLLTAHVALLPQCLDAVTSTRHLRAEDGSLLALTHASSDAASIVLAGSAGASVELVGGVRVIATTGPTAFLASLRGGDLSVLASIEDPTFAGGAAPLLPLSLGSSVARRSLAVGVVGSASIKAANGVVPVVDNPLNPLEPYPRSVAFVVDSEGSLLWQTALLGEKDQAFAATATSTDRLYALGPTRNAALLVDNPASGGSERLMLHAHERSGLLFSHDVCAADAQDVLEFDVVGASVIVVGDTPGVIVGGNFKGRCRVGGVRAVQVEASAATGFLARLNSEDGLGCD